jgi:replicative DNA helicase
MNTEERPLPHDIDAEYALLGWLLTDNRGMSQIGFLSPKDFYSRPHADIFAAMAKLHAAGESLTPFTIRPLLPQDTFEDAGGLIRYLSGAISAAVFQFKPAEAARYLLRLSQKRHLVTACEEVARAARSGQLTAEEHAADLAKVIDKITYASPLNDFTDNHQVGEAILDDLKDERRPYSTGLPKLDMAMDGGLYPGKSYGFAARKKVGKTCLAATISGNLNAANVKHVFICGEMSPKEIHQRVLARFADVFPSSFRNDYGKSVSYGTKLAEVIRAMPRATLYRNAPGLTFDELRRICTAAVERHKVTGIILDYWQLVGGKTKGQSTAEHLDEVAQWIADFGRKQGVWSITMAQINQEGNTRGSEGIRLAFDQVYELHRENLTNPDAWLEMMETRYTKWMNIGEQGKAGLLMIEKGPFFEEPL